MKVSEFLILTVFTFSIVSCKCNRTFTHDQPNTMKEPNIKREVIQPIKTIVESIDTNDVVLSELIEEPPLFDGKDIGIAFREYVHNNIKYPEEANEITGRILVEFIVEKDGSISNVKIILGIDPLLDVEALRVINNSPANWTPAKQRNKEVRYKLVFPVIFKLTSE